MTLAIETIQSVSLLERILIDNADRPDVIEDLQRKLTETKMIRIAHNDSRCYPYQHLVSVSCVLRCLHSRHNQNVDTSPSSDDPESPSIPAAIHVYIT